MSGGHVQCEDCGKCRVIGYGDWCGDCGYWSCERGPDCGDGKHRSCTGDGWDERSDAPAPCPCDCHEDE